MYIGCLLLYSSHQDIFKKYGYRKHLFFHMCFLWTQIDCEFEMNYPKCKKFMEIIPTLIQKILKMDHDCVQCDDGMCFMLYITDILCINTG